MFYLVGISKDGKEVFLRDIWPTRDEIQVCALRLKLNIFIYLLASLFVTIFRFVQSIIWNHMQRTVKKSFWEIERTIISRLILNVINSPVMSLY